jgi:hypothetical protein
VAITAFHPAGDDREHHNAACLRKSEIVPKLKRPIIEKFADICDRGKAMGRFRSGVDPLDLHWLISSFSLYNASNRATDMVLAAAVIGHEPASWTTAGA